LLEHSGERVRESLTQGSGFILFMEHYEERGCREINHNLLGFLFFSDGTPEGYGERGKHPTPGL